MRENHFEWKAGDLFERKSDMAGKKALSKFSFSNSLSSAGMLVLCFRSVLKIG